MPQKSRWDSDFWKGMKAFSVILAIIVSFLSILQWFGNVDVYNVLIMPVVNFFTIPIPLYSIPLAFLIVLIVLLVLAYISGSNTVTIGNPLTRADILDSNEIRYAALLCRTPQTTDFLKQKHQEFLRLNGGRYSSEDCLKELEDRDLLIFDGEKWRIAQKALDHIAKYHGD